MVGSFGFFGGADSFVSEQHLGIRLLMLRFLDGLVCVAHRSGTRDTRPYVSSRILCKDCLHGREDNRWVHIDGAFFL